MKITKIALVFAAIGAITLTDNGFAAQEFDENFEQQGYLQVFATKAQELGKKAISPFQAGYGYTDEEKVAAKHTIKELKKQKNEIISHYETVRHDVTDSVERHDLKKSYNQAVTMLDDQIYQQQLITGKKWSLQRKLLWTAMGAGTFALSIILVNLYVNALLAQAEKSAQEKMVLAIELKSLQYEAQKAQAGYQMVQEQSQNRKQALQIEAIKAKEIRETLENSYFDQFLLIITGKTQQIDNELNSLDQQIQESQALEDAVQWQAKKGIASAEEIEKIAEKELENLVNSRPLK